jgi:hypothetical protein
MPDLNEWYKKLQDWSGDPTNEIDSRFKMTDPQEILNTMFRETGATNYANPFYLARMKQNASNSMLGYQADRFANQMRTGQGNGEVLGTPAEFAKYYAKSMQQSPYAPVYTNRQNMTDALAGLKQGQQEYAQQTQRYQQDLQDYYKANYQGQELQDRLNNTKVTAPPEAVDENMAKWMQAQGRDTNYWNARMKMQQAITEALMNPSLNQDTLTLLSGMMKQSLGPSYGGLFQGALYNLMNENLQQQQNAKDVSGNFLDYLVQFFNRV